MALQRFGVNHRARAQETTVLPDLYRIQLLLLLFIVSKGHGLKQIEGEIAETNICIVTHSMPPSTCHHSG